jgi:hypothetical protein
MYFHLSLSLNRHPHQKCVSITWLNFQRRQWSVYTLQFICSRRPWTASWVWDALPGWRPVPNYRTCYQLTMKHCRATQISEQSETTTYDYNCEVSVGFSASLVRLCITTGHNAIEGKWAQYRVTNSQNQITNILIY